MFGLKKRKPLEDAMRAWLKQTVDGAFDVIPDTREALEMANVAPDENLDAEVFVETLAAAIVMGLAPLKTVGGDSMHQRAHDAAMKTLVPTLEPTIMSLLAMRVEEYERVWNTAIAHGGVTAPADKVAAELLFQLGAQDRDAVDPTAVSRISAPLIRVGGSFWDDLGRDFRIV